MTLTLDVLVQQDQDLLDGLVRSSKLVDVFLLLPVSLDFLSCS